MTNEQLNNIFDEFKTRLMKEIKPKIVNGVWYKYTHTKSKVNFTNSGTDAGYGINFKNEFTEGFWGINNLTPMSHDEIKDMLVKHADSLGIKEGVTVDVEKLKCFFDSDIAVIQNNEFKYYEGQDALFVGNFPIYKKGIWATVVKEKTSEDWIKEYTSPVCLKEFMQINNLEFIQRK